jgi:RNA polymerase sigma factor (sigma-70 family)
VVVTVAMNLSRSAARRRGAERRARRRMASAAAVAAPAHPSPSEAAEAIDVRNALDRLPPRQREVTILYYYLGFDVRGVASALGISAGTAKSTLHDARRTLATSLQLPRIESADDRAVADVHD